MSELSEAIQRLMDHVLEPKEGYKLSYHLDDCRNIERDIAVVIVQAECSLSLANGYAEQQVEIERLRTALSGAYTVLAVVLDDIKAAARAAGGGE